MKKPEPKALPKNAVLRYIRLHPILSFAAIFVSMSIATNLYYGPVSTPKPKADE